LGLLKVAKETRMLSERKKEKGKEKEKERETEFREKEDKRIARLKVSF